MYLLKNKNAVKMSFELGGKNLLFINCHLNPHEEGRLTRHEQWQYVCKRFVKEQYGNDLTNIHVEEDFEEISKEF